MTTGGAFNVSLSGLTDNADLFLVNSNNQIIQSSTLSGNSSETLSFQNLSAGIYSLQITSTAGPTDYLLGIQTPQTSTVEIDPLTGLPFTDNQLPTHPNFETGIFRVGETGIVNIDYLYDGGRFAGDFGLFNLAGMEAFTPGSTNYIREAARRALTNSSLGYTVISDATEGAKFGGVFTPTETDFNSGTYTGIKSFALNPGDTFGFILAPQDSLQTIFNNPALAGGRRPLFSMGTANPNDTFYQGQITRVTGNNTAFVFEDTPVLSPGGSTDYNDLIFQIQGSTGIAPSLTDYVYGGRDWRNTSNGQQIVNFINTADTIPPTIQAALANDTGEDNTDKITFDPTISGLVTDSSKIFSLRARFNNTPVGTYTDIVTLINSDGTFSLNRQQLETISGQILSEGEHTLHLQAIDKYGAVSNTYNLSFTLEPEVIPVLEQGGIYQFNGGVINGTLRPRQSQQFTFNLRNSEITSTASDTVLISMSVAAISGSNFQPGVPTIPGLTPLVSQSNTNNSYALFAFNTARQNTINLTGINSSTNGQYGLQLTVAGDINLDDKVDGTDAQLLTQALGITSNNPSYSLNLDINRDGVINNSDLELLNQNFGFVANTPAVITPSDILTHQELETTIDLEKFVSDADNDALTYSISNPINGTLETTNNGQTVVFKPASNFAGVGSFDISVDDGYYKASETININVSGAPLINLEIIKSKKQLNVGETISLEVQGDFADAEDVVLPDSYLTYATENAEIAQISESGDVTGLTEGTTILSVKRNNISAVTAIRSGEIPIPKNDSEFNQALAEINGLDAYPDAVTLTVGGKRQLLVGVNDVVETPDLKTASSGTRYFVSDLNILSVTADGEVTGLKEGFATVTIINGVADEVVPIRVQIPQNNQTIINTSGGAVRSDDGAMVMVAPGSLNEDTAVSIQQLSEQQLSLPVPDNFSFAGAFQLELGSEPLDVPVQLAIPAPQNLAAGTEVFFMRKVSLPDETGTMKTMWLVDESGIVGNDGMIRTSSPPWQGAYISGEYTIAIPKFEYSVERLQLAIGVGVAGVVLGVSGVAIAVLDPKQLGLVAVGLGAIGGALYATVPLLLNAAERSVTVLTIPKVGLPYKTESGVAINPGQISTLSASIPSPPLTPTAPSLNKIEVMIPPPSAENPQTVAGRVIYLTGDNFGSNINDLQANFHFGGKIYPGRILPESPGLTELEKGKIAVVTDFVPYREAEISVSRKFQSIIGTVEEEESQIAKIPVDICVEVAVVAQPFRDQVSILNTLNPRTVVEQTSSRDLLIGSIGVGSPEQQDIPRYAAVTSNASRAYVSLQSSGRIAVVDVMGVKQLNSNSELGVTNLINLPTGARPSSIVIDYRDQYAYVAERQRGAVYVLDINPFSLNYNKCIGTIALNNANNGISQMAISGDGKRLFATTSDSSTSGIGQILVINIDPQDRPVANGNNERNWHKEIGRIVVGAGLEGISATPDPFKMVFTNRFDESKGYGVLTITNNDPKSFAATVNYAGMNLGFATDYFDVNEAVAVTVMRDEETGQDYAFVAARNGRGFGSGIESIDGVRAGSNIGIIEDALGPNPRLVAATRPIPNGLTSGLAISSDGRYLTAAYPGIQSSLMFDVKEILKTVQNPIGDLTTTPIDDLNPAISIAADFKDIGNPLDSLQNKIPFGVPAFSNTPPLTTGGSPFSVAMTSVRNPVNLLPVDVSGDPLKPRFTWNFDGKKEAELPEAGMCIDPLKDEEVEEVNLYVSVFDKDNGLLPERWTPTDGIEGVDYNPNRVLTARWKGGVWSWNGGSKEGSKYEFSLPDDRMLTAGQTYHWAVKVKLKNQPATYIFEDEEYKVPLAESANPNTFSSVTVLSRGLEVQPNLINRQFEEMANYITKPFNAQNEGGLVLYYEADTGQWYWRNSQGAKNYNIPQTKFSKPLVLIPDLEMTSQKTGFNSGFAEAAADTLFASLVSLNQKIGNDALFKSPTHFIGIGQGAVINSEIIQRMGTFFPNIWGNGTNQIDLQMTSVDPHDFTQQSLQSGFRSRNDPTIKVWENVTFADNFYQNVAPSVQPRTDTRNGRAIEEADLNVSLNNRAAFAPDDTENSAHRQTLAWYAGTANLNASELPPLQDRSPKEKIYRRLGDLEAADRIPNNDKIWYTPDYRGYPYIHGSQNAPWEGIGTGWFYSALGGGKDKRQFPLLGVRTPVNFDNSAEARMQGDFAVPTLFNGNFDAISSRFSQQNIPGWSFYNGPQNTTQNVSQQHLVEWSEITSLDPNFLAGVGYDSTQSNYALKLSSAGQRQVTHNRFVVPEWGTLRFNLHVPNLNGGNLKVFIQGDAPDYENYQAIGNIDLRLADGRVNPGATPEISYPLGYADTDTNRIDYGNRGFETFHIDIPDELRGKSARLKFELEGNDTVYLDDVFFKSVHLKLGNPTFAQPFENTHRENYLIEKPQYALSYNDAIKGPNWVSWQLNKSWLGNTDRPGMDKAIAVSYPPTNYPPNSAYSADVFDYPWLSDNTLPAGWVTTASPDYRASFGLDKGHMIPVNDRTRTQKDIYSTFFTTNVLPQQQDANQFGAWRNFEQYTNGTLVQQDGRELYMIAGGVGYGSDRQTGFPSRTVTNNILLRDGIPLTDGNGRPRLANSVPKGSDGNPDPKYSLQPVENSKLIRVPEYIWKIAVVMEPGQKIADITDQTQVIALITPNRSQLITPGSFPLPNGVIKDITNWNDWTQWQVSVDYLEEITGFDFLSNVPEETQKIIESRSAISMTNP